jgi:hypothetical protein
MAAAVRFHLLLLVAVTFQLSHVAACFANEPPATSARDSSEAIGEAPAGEAPTCVKDETSRRRLAEICSAENFREFATEAPAFGASLDPGQPLFAGAGAIMTPAVSLHSERIRLQI